MKVINKSEPYLMYGLHPCIEALKNPERKIIEIFCKEKIFYEYQTLISSRNYKLLNEKDIDKLFKQDTNHQGIVIKLLPIIKDNIEFISSSNKNLTFAILDQITDPHNIGAIIRSAAAFDIDAVILTEYNSPSETGVIAKSACGALEHVKLIKVKNLSLAIKFLKKHNFWIVGLTSESNQDNFSNKFFDGNVAFVLGSEQKGLRKLTQDNCDVYLHIPLSARVESLNVSNAAAIIFFESFKYRRSITF